MTDSDLPSIEEPPPPRARWRRSAMWLLLEVVLISGSVFLGLLGQQWVENRQHREQAKEALRRFRTEIAANRDTVKRTYDYHAPLQKSVKAFVGADAKGRESITLNIQGPRPPFLEDTAWELALATQSLSYIQTDLAFRLSRIYMLHDVAEDLSLTVLQAMYANPPAAHVEEFILDMDLYFGDITRVEQELLDMYDAVLPQIDRALSD